MRRETRANDVLSSKYNGQSKVFVDFTRKFQFYFVCLFVFFFHNFNKVGLLH